MSFRKMSNLILKTPSYGESTSSLGKLFQCLITLTARRRCLISRLNLSNSIQILKYQGVWERANITNMIHFILILNQKIMEILKTWQLKLYFGKHLCKGYLSAKEMVFFQFCKLTHVCKVMPGLQVQFKKRHLEWLLLKKILGIN